MESKTLAPSTTDTIETLNQHVSIRRYQDAPIDNELLLSLLRAAQRSPTSSNMQAYSFIIVRDPDTKRQLAALGGNQRHIETAPVFVAICADISRLMAACEMHGTTLARNTENMLVAAVDAAIAGMSLATAAESVGLGTVMIGGMRNHPAEVAALLDLPAGAYCVYGLCLGWPAKVPPQKPRMSEDLIFHFERYNHDLDVQAGLSAYDAELAAHYRAQERNSPDAAWTGVIAEKFSRPRRPELRATLEALGYRFD